MRRIYRGQTLARAITKILVSVVSKVIRRVEVGAWIEDRIKEGYTKGSWKHVPQSQSIEIKAWNPQKTRGDHQ